MLSRAWNLLPPKKPATSGNNLSSRRRFESSIKCKCIYWQKNEKRASGMGILRVERFFEQNFNYVPNESIHFKRNVSSEGCNSRFSFLLQRYERMKHGELKKALLAILVLSCIGGFYFYWQQPSNPEPKFLQTSSGATRRYNQIENVKNLLNVYFMFDYVDSH